jgi:hypothetical protein
MLVVPATSVAVKLEGIKGALYTDPNRVAPGNLMWTNDESTFAHDCYGNRITVQGSPDRLMDPHSTHLRSLWQLLVNTEIGWGAVFDYVFEDSADEIQTQKLSALPCHFDQNSWTNATNQMDSQLSLPIVYNGLGLIPGGGPGPGPSIGLNPTTKGGMSEDCYSGRTPTGFFFAPHWEGTENTEIQMAQAGKLFICQADWYQQASSSMRQRLYFYASFLLTYDRSSQMVGSRFLTPSALHVMPEAQLVPTNPLKSTPSDIKGLLEPSGLYGREYGACYYRGSYVGACAVVVNPTNPRWNPSLKFPWPSKYHHTLVMSGAGVYDGGTARVDGPAPPADVPGATGIIAFR